MKKVWRSLGVSGQGVLAALALGGAFFAVRGLRLNADATGPDKRRTPITEFKLISAQSRFTRSEDSSMPIPVIEYLVQIPGEINPFIEAAIVGADGRQLPLHITSGTTEFVKFSRTGYSYAPASPKFVITRAKKPVFEVPVDPLPAPTRAIPLVVPIREDSFLLPVDRKAEGNEIPPGLDTYIWRLQMPENPKTGWLGPTGPYPNLVRTEWPSDLPMYNNYVSKGQRVFTTANADLGAFAEVVTMDPQVKAEVREVDVDVEIHDRDDGAGFRVLSPVHVVFSDHATFDFLAEERKMGRNRQGKLSRNVSLPISMSGGYAGLIQEPNRIRQFDLPLDGEYPQESKPGANANYLEIVSPPLADLGIARVQWGTREILAKPARELAMGRHRIRFRVVHAVGVAVAQRHFIRIEPQPSPGPGTKRTP